MKKLAFGGNRGALFLLGAAVFLATFTFGSSGAGGNVNSRIDLVMAVVDHHEVNIDRYHNAPPMDTGDKAYHDGHFYSDKTIGLSLLGVPVYAATHAAATVAGKTLTYANVLWALSRGAVATCSAIAAMLMASLLIRLGALPRRAVLATAGAFFGSMLFGYSTVFMPYLPGIAACLGALWIVLSPPLTMRRALLAGFLLGYALILDLTFVFVVLTIGAFLLRELLTLDRRGAVRLALATVGAAAVPVGGFVAYCVAIFGSASIPYRYEYSDFFRTSMDRGIMGATMPKPAVMWYLSFHPYRGIFFWSPWMIIAGVCCVAIWRHERGLRPFAVATVTVFVAYFLFNSGYYLWWGGQAMGPRLTLPMFAVVPLVLVVACRADSPRWLWVSLMTTMAVSVALCLPLSISDPQTIEGNSVERLLHPHLGSGFRVPQLDVLRDFYTLRWTDVIPGETRSVIARWLMCFIVIGGCTWLSWRTARRAETVAGAKAVSR